MKLNRDKLPELLRAALLVASLGAIGSGVWLVSPPAALITVGGLIWIDLAVWSFGLTRTKK